MFKVLGMVGLVMFGSFLGLLITEMAFRIFLWNTYPDRFARVSDERPAVWFMEKSRWNFNEAYGYEYGSHTVYGGSAADGRVKSCWQWPANRRGNMGLIEGDYDTAEIKVLVFGDSFTAQIDTSTDKRGIAWTNFFQRRLAEEKSTSVHVVNFGRDGTGILHMADLAADMVLEWHPDIVVFAFITDDLTRARFWRTATIYKGNERVFTTTVPLSDPPYSKSADTAIIHSGATPEWCEHMVKSGDNVDPILIQMERVVLEAKRRANRTLSLYSVSTSLLFNQLLHGDAFQPLVNQILPSQNPRHKLTDFGQDKRFLHNVAKIKSGGADIFLLHLALSDELAAGKEYIFQGNEEVLLTSLSRHFNLPVHESISVPEPKDGYAAIKRSPNDSHPSLEGMKFYAEAAVKAVISH